MTFEKLIKEYAEQGHKNVINLSEKRYRRLAASYIAEYIRAEEAYSLLYGFGVYQVTEKGNITLDLASLLANLISGNLEHDDFGLLIDKNVLISVQPKINQILADEYSRIHQMKLAVNQ